MRSARWIENITSTVQIWMASQANRICPATVAGEREGCVWYAPAAANNASEIAAENAVVDAATAVADAAGARSPQRIVQPSAAPPRINVRSSRRASSPFKVSMIASDQTGRAC